MDQPSAHHMVRHDPERVLAECDAKRQIVTAHARWQDALSGTAGDDARRTERLVAWQTLGHVLRVMALPYADHSDYTPEWQP
ncbi:hypothetical protein SAMN05660359_04267 [Geodermatophilus obscurus]|uniref:Uncharacterized protein n=2 Tax=Geodermatophilus obscurus TaxID=1861 RepID=A0A1I5I261_9ACTN|nr:hypothetical protein SAMN05660359_04267 [Geodermatophilus obscurus]